MKQSPAISVDALPADAPHVRLRPAVLLFCLYAILQFGSGALLYAWKIGFDPALTTEFYIGSERMLEIYPEARDRFMQPKSFGGLLKIALAHFASYGVTVFILTHLLRSLVGRPSQCLEWFCLGFFAIALLEILSGFLVAFGGMPVHARTAVFVLFEVCGLLAIALLLGAALPRPRIPRWLAASASAFLIPAALALAGGSGCMSYASRYTTGSYSDSEKRVVRLEDNIPGGAFRLPGSMLEYSAEIGLQRVVFADGASAISLFVILRDYEFLNIPEGPSLELILDGERYALVGSGSGELQSVYQSAEEAEGGPILREVAYWHQVPPEVIRALQAAQSGRVLLRGANETRRFVLTDRNLSNFRRFLRDEADLPAPTP